jgi:predicted nucleotidyltransferase component of viral defense system
MLSSVDFVKEYYQNQIETLKDFIKEAYPNLPNKDSSCVRFGGGTALAMYYFQHRLSFDVDLFVRDPQIINYLSPKHWIEESSAFGDETYLDLANHIRVLSSKNKIKLDVLVAQDNLGACLVDDSYAFFDIPLHVESIEDIIAKKIVYRRIQNLTRDVIDIAVAIEKENILEKLLRMEAIAHKDIDELNAAMLNLDIAQYDFELELIKPFEKYRKIATNAPRIIKENCALLI